jgi:two-component system, sensor histidine kinase PdtaS
LKNKSLAFGTLFVFPSQSPLMKNFAFYPILLGLDNEATIVCILFFLALLAVCIDRYRIIKQSKDQLYQQQQALDHKVLELEHVHLSRNRLLAEKEWLLKEIHHRVKNSLQVAMSLLNTQSHYLENEKAVAALRQSRNRMYAMSIIHQRLYQSDNLELIHMNRYIPELIKYIKESFAEDRHLQFRLHIDPVRLDVDQAVPIGLIINEAVTNSIKYAFPDRNDGAIDIRLQDLCDQGLRLEIADDGIGLRQDFDIKRVRSMGMELIDSLNLQLEGRMTISNKGGTAICIVFLRASERHDPLAAPVFEK